MSNSSLTPELSADTSADFDSSLSELTSKLLTLFVSQETQNCSININTDSNKNSAQSSDNLNILSNSFSNNSNNLNSFSIMTSRPQIEIKPLELVPEFDGSPCRLFRFISMASEVLNTYWDSTPANINCPQNMYIFNSIISKLRGRAEEVISISGSQTWEEVKDTLVTNFGDQRDENSLLADLISLRQKPNEDCVQFYYRIIATLNTLHNYISLHENNFNVRKSKLDTYNNQALRTLFVGLREPQQSMIRSLKPAKLSEALKYMIEDNNIRYMSRQNNYQKPVMPRPNTSHNMTKQNLQQPFNHYLRPTTSRMDPQINIPTHSQFPQGPVQIQPNQNIPPRRFPTNQQVFGKQPTNVWKPGQHKNYQQYKSTPMSTTTRNYVQNRQQNYRPTHFQSSGPPNFVSEELFNVYPDESGAENSIQETYHAEFNYDDNNHLYDENPEYDETVDDNIQNFHLNPNSETET